MSDQVWSLVRLKEKILAANKQNNIVVLLSSEQEQAANLLFHLLYSESSDSSYWVKFVSSSDPVIKDQFYKVALHSSCWCGSTKERRAVMRWCDRTRGFLGVC